MKTREIMNRLNELLATVESAYMTIARENSLTYNALMLLLMLDETDRLTQKQVCDALYLPKSTVHSMLSDLTDRGYLLLVQGSNKKEKYIRPTGAGKKFIQKVSAETEKMESSTLESIPEEEASAFLKTAERLAQRLSEEAQKLYESEGETK